MDICVPIFKNAAIRRLVCWCIGHCWGWPELYFAVVRHGDGTAVVLRSVWRECRRCHAREADDDRCTSCVVLPSFQGPVVGLAAPLDVLGEKVRKEMGW